MKLIESSNRFLSRFSRPVTLILLAWALVGLDESWREYNTEVSWNEGYYGNGIFDYMSLQEAGAKSAEMARTDFRSGRYQQLVFGLRYANKYDDYLLERYQVATVPVAGCLIGDRDEVVANSYNATMAELLMVKYGRDVFEEARQAARE